jgi:hypothetical protein
MANNKIPLFSNIISGFFPILLFVFFWSCQNSEINNVIIKNDTANSKSLIKDRSLPTNYWGYYKLDGDSLIIPSFEIEVNLTPKADKKIKENKETIIVAAYFSGKPKDTTSKEYRNDGKIFVTSAKIELNDARIAKFEGVKFSKTLYDSLASKDIQLLVNIYSGRKSTQDNLLNGGFLSEKMSNVKGKLLPMKAKLIYNDD